MIVRRFALLLLSLAFPVAAHAQFSAYGMFTAERFGGIQCLDTSCGNSSGSVAPIGGTGGLPYVFRT